VRNTDRPIGGAACLPSSRVAEEAFMREPIDFQADLRPPPED
jgi:hypothetical protein